MLTPTADLIAAGHALIQLLIFHYLLTCHSYNCNCCVIVHSVELQWARNVAAQASKLLANIYLIHACRCCEFGYIRYFQVFIGMYCSKGGGPNANC